MMLPHPRTASAAATACAAVLLSAAGGAQAAAHAEVDLSAVPSGTYQSDPTHSYITFTYSHLGLSNPMLSFDDFDVQMELDDADPTKSTIAVTIDPASIVAGSETWHEHLTGAEFFDVAEYPEITFTSTGVEAAGDGAYKVEGDLTIKGQTKPATLDVTINAAMNHPMSGEPVVGLTGSSQVLRSDYGMDKFAPNVSDEVTINFTAEMNKAK